ncbi:MAG: outer membrane biogenesis protein BamB [Planctomycetes bacterium ADurb.Bin126]|nr:MAG: outer membrane biogenesis protein BamB [Planctomycetes bacterium ADurb.Bin126]HOD82608.1 PQQ-binding-like beta-propeller repeat protein [Phycisphaerae bacterium]HQL75031.1 PQQ-binding-like beta-propeller repeat protein [Phycisphaerae bacterium]
MNSATRPIPFLFLAVLLTAAVVWAQPASIEPVTTLPSGGYVVARLEIGAGLQDVKDKAAPSSQRLLITLRGGKLANLWFVRPMAGDNRLMVERSTLALTEKSLAGEVELRTTFNRGSPQVTVALKLDLAVTDGKLSGRYEIAADKTPYKSAAGAASGVLLTRPPAEDAVSPKGSWSSFWGSRHDMSCGEQPALVADLSRARPVWRSETYVPTGYGNAPDNRYFTRAIVSGNCGGGSSPVVADGTVFVYFYRPSPQSEPATKGSPFWRYKDDADFQARMAALNATPREVEQLLNHFRPLADDHVVAIDAATGAEKWHTALPLRSPNQQTHKHRGLFGVPLAAGDTLYVPNHASRLYALDAGTGRLKWETPAFTAPDAKASVRPPLTPSPMLIAGNLLVAWGSWFDGKVHALDPNTGKEKWQAPGSYVMRWTCEGKDRLVTLTGLDKRKLSCIDPGDGRVLWQEETDVQAVAPQSAVIAGDMLLAAPPPPRGGPNVVRYEGWKLSADGARRIWQDAEFPGDENVPVTVSGGRAYLLGKQLIRCLDTATGRQVTERKFQQHGPGSNAWLGVVGERLLLSPEGQHGVARLVFPDRDLHDLGLIWLPPHVETTAYNSQPIVYPIVDGRLFIRGGDGVYCYDLRSGQ